MENKQIKFIAILTVYLIVVIQLTGQSYTYDDLNRLTQVDYGSGVIINYSYDALGNRTQYVVNGDCIDLSTISGASEASFEAGLSSWAQSTSDDGNWTLYEGSTPTNVTGPSNASTGDQYLYTESSEGNYNNQHIIESPCFDMSQIVNANLSFDYHMYGTTVGTLNVEISTNGGTSYSTLLPEVSGNQGNSWYGAVANLSSYLTNNVKIRIIATTGSGFRSDIAIDNIQIELSDCPPDLTVSSITEPVYESQNTLSTSGNVIVNSGNNVQFKSNEITLNSGFEVKSNAIFTILIDPCSN